MNYLNVALRMLILLASVYSLVIAIIFYSQEKLIFKPVKLPQDHRFKLPEVDEIKILSNDIELSALHYKREDPIGVVLFLHGNSGSLDNWLTDTEFYNKVNFDLIMIDYRGYGKSSGKIQSEQQLLYDVESALRFAKQKYGNKKLVIYGRSLGTALAAYLSNLNNVDLTILVTPYYNLNAMRKLNYSWVPEFAMRYKLDTANYIKSIKNPVLILHGNQDEFIPLSQAKQLAALNSNAKLITIEGASHNNIHTFDFYKQSLIEYFRNHLS